MSPLRLFSIRASITGLFLISEILPSTDSKTHFKVDYLTELCLHSRKDHDDGHHSAQQQKDGEDQPCDSGVIGRGTTATQEAWC